MIVTNVPQDAQLIAYEHAGGSDASGKPPPQHSLIFVNGLFGTLLSVPYVHAVAASLPVGWVLVEAELSSARLGFGVGSISNDVAELARLVAFLRTLRPRGKIALLGHSTGCQDALAYVSTDLTPKERKAGATARPPVDGIVLQAPASDRLAMEQDGDATELSKARAAAEALVQDGRANDVLPRGLTGALGHAPISARRWLSLTSPPPEHSGEDDMFSDDLPDDRLAQTFGRVPKGVRVLALLSGADQYVPASVNQGALAERWRAALLRSSEGIWDIESGILDGADHALENGDESVVTELTRRVCGFLERIAYSNAAEYV